MMRGGGMSVRILLKLWQKSQREAYGIVMRHILIQAKISTCQQSTNCPLWCPNTFAARDFHLKQSYETEILSNVELFSKDKKLGT